ncbi:hypothetical protein TRFO_27747 [Tritrichomonas foetus]|uniref:Uncharacterized protein n=1 Tax=Tritrichomonas foetus TaxID=1144522 RepID=A0A1J4K1K9_9EUKA|nr:hypothetical protein TRFO_27747 [Tritrichomonas foetus]|eukprot:OHT04672.1 hypothetical protein TRFO_27747 [Tritrichomonas foetus]
MFLLFLHCAFSLDLTPKIATAFNTTFTALYAIMNKQFAIPMVYPDIQNYTEYFSMSPKELLIEFGVNQTSIEAICGLAESINPNSTLTSVLVDLMNLMGLGMTVDSFKMVMPSVIDTLRANDHFYKFMNIDQKVFNYILGNYSANIIAYKISDLTQFLGINIDKFITSFHNIGASLNNPKTTIPEFFEVLGHENKQEVQDSLDYVLGLMTGPITLEVLSQWQEQIQKIIYMTVNTLIKALYNLLNDSMPILKPILTMTEASYKERLDALDAFCDDVQNNLSFSFLQIFLTPEMLKSIRDAIPKLKNSIPIYQFFNDTSIFAGIAYLLNEKTPIDVALLSFLEKGPSAMNLLKLLSNKDSLVPQIVELFCQIINYPNLPVIINQTIYDLLDENVPLQNLTFLQLLKDFDPQTIVDIINLSAHIMYDASTKQTQTVIKAYDLQFQALGLSSEMVISLATEAFGLINMTGGFVQSMDQIYNTTMQMLSYGISSLGPNFSSEAREYDVILSQYITDLIIDISALLQPDNKLSSLVDVLLPFNGGELLLNCFVPLLNLVVENKAGSSLMFVSKPIQYLATLLEIMKWREYPDEISFPKLINTIKFHKDYDPSKLPLHLIYGMCQKIKELNENETFYSSLLYSEFLLLNETAVLEQLNNLQMNILTSKSAQSMASSIAGKDITKLFALLENVSKLTFKKEPIPSGIVANFLNILSTAAPEVPLPEVPQEEVKPEPQPTNKGIPPGGIAGIVIACVVVVIVIIVVIVCVKKKQSQNDTSRS